MFIYAEQVSIHIFTSISKWGMTYKSEHHPHYQFYIDMLVMDCKHGRVRKIFQNIKKHGFVVYLFMSVRCQDRNHEENTAL